MKTVIPNQAGDEYNQLEKTRASIDHQIVDTKTDRSLSRSEKMAQIARLKRDSAGHWNTQLTIKRDKENTRDFIPNAQIRREE